ncbi:hypothetical protein [Desulfosoma sp.]
MGSYDAAVKVILSHCRQAALEYFLGLEVVESEIVEFPQETASLRRSDFPIRVRTPEGRLFIVLLEVQSRWEPELPLRLFGIRRTVSPENGLVGSSRYLAPHSQWSRRGALRR